MNIHQTDEEKRIISKALLGQDTPQPTQEERGLTLLKKNKKLIEAAATGDSSGVLLWLEAGADPNYHEEKVGYRRDLVLDYALKKCTAPAVLALIEKGGTLNGLSLLKEGQILPKGIFTPPERLGARPEKEHMIAFCHKAVSESSIEVMEALCQAYPDLVITPREWVEKALGKSRHAVLGHWLRKSGAMLSAREWKEYFDDHMGRELLVQGSFSIFQKATLISIQNSVNFIEEFLPQMPEELLKPLFGIASAFDHKNLLAMLLKNGYKPDSDWQGISPLNNYYWGDEKEQTTAPIAALALAGALRNKTNSASWAILKQIGPVMDAAREYPIHPRLLFDLTITQLLSYHAEGMPINGVDEQGNNIAHLWAMRDREPRDGWRTLLKVQPELTTAVNKKGESAFETLIGKLRNEKDKNEYREAASNIERQSLMKESVKVAKKSVKTASKGASRL